jgi:hypothetical protein
MNTCICKQREKKSGKLIIRNIFLSPRAITSWNINGPEPNSNLICILVSADMSKTVGPAVLSVIFDEGPTENTWLSVLLSDETFCQKYRIFRDRDRDLEFLFQKPRWRPRVQFRWSLWRYFYLLNPDWDVTWCI